LRSRDPATRALIVPAGSTGYAALYEIESGHRVQVLAVRHPLEQNYHQSKGALNWLQSPNAALGGVTPLSLLDTDIGADGVLDTLGRIEHGVFA